MTAEILAAIFDLDGVLTSTSIWHEQSWTEAATKFGIPISAEALAATRSVPRGAALSALLAHAKLDIQPNRRDEIMAYKNERYQELIQSLTPSDAFEGANCALESCRRLGLKTGVASASLNAAVVLARIGLSELVDFVADPTSVTPKPSSDIYRLVCKALGSLPSQSACIEDGAPMIANLRRDGFYTIGIGRSPLEAHEQHVAISDWSVGASVTRLRRGA